MKPNLRKSSTRSKLPKEVFGGKVLAISHTSILSANRIVYRQLHEKGVDLELVVPTRLNFSRNAINADPQGPGDPPIHALAPQWRNLRLLRYPQLAEFLTQIRPAIVVAEIDTASLLALEIGRWCQRNGAKLIIRTNENLSWTPSDSVARAGWRALPVSVIKCICNRLAVENVSAVCVSSHSAVRIFRKNGFRNPLNLPMGTDRSRFRYRSSIRRTVRNELGLRASDIVISYFGRLAPEKGIETLIEALGGMAEFDWRFFLNGFQLQTAYLDTILKCLEEADIADRVHWIESKHGELARYMTASDVTVLPSRTTRKWTEQFGRVVPEAMACGNLVMVSDSGAPKELVGPSGIVFPEGDARELERLLRHFLLHRDDCLRRRKAAIRHVHRHLPVGVEVEKYLDLFRRVAFDI